MRQLLLIANPRGAQQIDDYVGDFNADHKFSQKEHEIFSIVEVDDSVVEAYKAEQTQAHQMAQATGSELKINRTWYDREKGKIRFN